MTSTNRKRIVVAIAIALLGVGGYWLGRQRSGSDSGTSTVATASDGGWVASSRGHTYYRAGCGGAKKLSPANLIYFKSEADAQRAGLRHSVQDGC